MRTGDVSLLKYYFALGREYFKLSISWGRDFRFSYISYLIILTLVHYFILSVDDNGFNKVKLLR